jgi:branched-subunit amino acid permease
MRPTPVIAGFLAGYQTMDTIAALVFGTSLP